VASVADSLRARIAEALTREDVNWGYDAGFSAAPDDDRTTAYAAAVMAVVQPELDRLTAEAEEDRRALIEQPVLRHCVYPGCLREFDASAALSGRPTRESWSSKGWLQVQVLLAHICPDHAPLVAEDAHRPQWLNSGKRLVCACGWESVPVRWRGYATEAWKDHVLTITEEGDRG
jgi:hypothetical protein